MKAICLGGAGRICREAVFDLVQFSSFDEIIVADSNETEGRNVVAWFVQVPPFARPRDIELPPPYGSSPQYIIPHAETKTLAKKLAHKGVRLIEVRGTWPQKNMQLVRALYDWGFLRNDKIQFQGRQFGIMDAIAAYLMQSPQGQATDLYGYALHVEVIGTRDGKPVRWTLWHTHPASDGSQPGWENLRAYTRNVGIPMSIGAQMLARGLVKKTGVITPEEAFEPEAVFAELRKRQILVHTKSEKLENASCKFN